MARNRQFCLPGAHRAIIPWDAARTTPSAHEFPLPAPRLESASEPRLKRTATLDPLASSSLIGSRLGGGGAPAAESQLKEVVDAESTAESLGGARPRGRRGGGRPHGPPQALPCPKAGNSIEGRRRQLPLGSFCGPAL